MTRTRLRLVRDDEPRWSETTPPTGLPVHKVAPDPEAVVIMNPALVAWMMEKVR